MKFKNKIKLKKKEINPGEGNGQPLQYSCLENSRDRGAWQATVHGIVELDMTEWLSLFQETDNCTRYNFGNSKLQEKLQVGVFYQKNTWVINEIIFRKSLSFYPVQPADPLMKGSNDKIPSNCKVEHTSLCPKCPW